MMRSPYQLLLKGESEVEERNFCFVNSLHRSSRGRTTRCRGHWRWIEFSGNVVLDCAIRFASRRLTTAGKSKKMSFGCMLPASNLYLCLLHYGSQPINCAPI